MALALGRCYHPFWRALGEGCTPHVLYLLGCIVYAQPPLQLASQAEGKARLAGHLDPVIGGHGLHVMIRLAGGSMKRWRRPIL